MNQQLIIHPDFDAAYDGFYLKGFKDVFPLISIAFNRKKFPFATTTVSAFIFNYNGKTTNIIIDSRDFDTVENEELNWADVYAKVNINTDKNITSPLISLSPSFGIKYANNLSMLAYCMKQMMGGTSFSSKKKVFQNTYTIIKHRYAEDVYLQQSVVDPSFIFFKSTLWKDNDFTTKTRAEFIRVARTIDHINFEGGFAKRVDGNAHGYEDLIDGHRISFKEYLDKTKKSLLVFNTPAVKLCHGWKLGEFLALGKAIISTPLTRALPSPLVHGTHLHIIDDVNEVKEAIEVIRKSTTYRQHLQANARKYYDDFGSAKASIKLIMSAAGITYKTEPN